MTITPVKVGIARMLMGQGRSMQEAAIALGVRSCDLDRSLWAYIGTPTDDLIATAPRHVLRKYDPDF